MPILVVKLIRIDQNLELIDTRVLSTSYKHALHERGRIFLHPLFLSIYTLLLYCSTCSAYYEHAVPYRLSLACISNELLHATPYQHTHIQKSAFLCMIVRVFERTSFERLITCRTLFLKESLLLRKMDVDQRKIILHVSNISLDVSGVDVWRHFAEIGIIKIFKLYDDGEADILYFDNMDVEKAISKYNLQTFRGKVLILSEGERM